MDACRRGRVSPNQGAAPPLGGPLQAKEIRLSLSGVSGLGASGAPMDVRRASSSRTAGPRDQHSERAHTLLLQHRARSSTI